MNKHPDPPWALRDLAGILFPQRCPVCDEPLAFGPRYHAPLSAIPDPYFHPDCFKKLKILACAAKSPGSILSDSEHAWSFEKLLSLLHYNEAARFSVARFKYHGRQDFAIPYGRLMARYLGDAIRDLKGDALVPVPIHRSRLCSRGYNQAALLAWELERHLGIPCREDLVMRIKHTDAQKELGRRERLLNMKDAFRLRRMPRELERIIIVDDIFTTGSTAESLSRVLKEGGASHIFVVTLCLAGAGE